MTFDLLIRNGLVVAADRVAVLDVGVLGAEISAVGKPGALGARVAKVIDATGLYVLPGAIDPHTHIESRWMGLPSPGFEVQSIAAAHGGTTTFIDFTHATAKSGIAESVERRCSEIDGNTAVDYALHAGLVEPSWGMLEEVRSIVEGGIPSFKLFLHGREGPVPEDSFIYALLKEVAACRGIAMVHAENDSLVRYFTSRLLAEGKTGVEHFPESRPNIAEAESVRRVIFLAGETGAAIYFVHLSTKEAIALVKEARWAGLPIYSETCPHYLAFNDEVYRQDRAIQFIRFPPIRSRADQEALWDGVSNGTIDCIGTDHVAASLSVKKSLSQGKPFNELPGGMGQIETRLGYMYSEGVATGRINIRRLVDLVSTNPAKVFGIYPQKGTISIGSDADIVLFDPMRKRKVASNDLHMGLDYSVYEGYIFIGATVMTIARGKIIVEGGRYLGSLSDGRFLKRKPGEGTLKKRDEDVKSEKERG